VGHNFAVEKKEGLEEHRVALVIYSVSGDTPKAPSE
jgi:hypothetical protein